MDMLRNLEFFAYNQQCYIVIAFSGRIQPADHSKAQVYRKNEFLAQEYANVIKAKKALDRSDHRASGFTVPVGFRTFVRQYDFANMKVLFTEGDHVATVCKWLDQGIPKELTPTKWPTTEIVSLLGYRNEYILKLMGQKRIQYFHSPSLKLGRADSNNIPTYFRAACIVPDCFQKQNALETKTLSLCSLLLDGDGEYLPANELDRMHARFLNHEDEYLVVQEMRQMPGSTDTLRRYLEICRIENEINSLAGSVKKEAANNADETKLDALVELIYQDRANNDPSLRQNIAKAIARIERIVGCKLLETYESMKDDSASSILSQTMSSVSHEAERDTFYSRYYELDDDYPTEDIIGNVYRTTQKGELEPWIYQAMTTETALIPGGGVYDYRHDLHDHPLTIYQSIREMIYAFVFPANTDLNADIVITEYYHHSRGDTTAVVVKPSQPLEVYKKLLVSDGEQIM